MSIASGIAKDTEFIKLFLHEFGHYIDIHVLKSSSFIEDPSKEFYKISWKSKDIKLPGLKLGDFVSGYAATDQYEDFAETFVLYVFHNVRFADMALVTPILREKYLFFRSTVFPN